MLVKSIKYNLLVSSAVEYASIVTQNEVKRYCGA